MCGIVGAVKTQDRPGRSAIPVAAMTETLVHRGPDSKGYWQDERAGVALGHRRLSILDLTPTGHQPMHSRTERYCMAYNGEVYNYREIKSELAGLGHAFVGSSDTEVLLAAFEQWGVVNALERFNGMFALGLWDRRERRLYLARDRLGIKPLYYGRVDGWMVFASELKAFRACEGFEKRLNLDAVATLLRLGYIVAPLSIYDGVFKLPPGHYLEVSAECGGTQPEPTAYWSLLKTLQAGRESSCEGDENEVVEQLDALLSDAVRKRLVSDVPLGAFLSGGIDSSAVVALMQANCSTPVKTFSIGFHEASHDEARHAAAVARHLGTDHTELYVTPGEALEVIPQLPQLCDEPMGDSSQVPTYLVSRLARRQVVVSLSGDGGDESFFGYTRYLTGSKLWRRSRATPSWLRRLTSTVCASSTVSKLAGGMDRAAAVLALGGVRSSRANRARKLAALWGTEEPLRFCHRFMSFCQNPQDLVAGTSGLTEPFPLRECSALDFVTALTYFDMRCYLPDDILVKLDRASMGVSLEARVPLLDHRVVEFAARIPIDMKYRNGQQKWILRQVLKRYVPSSLVDRPKRGFAVPLARWLRGPLRDWAESLLEERRLEDERILNARSVRKLWSEHLSGAVNNAPLLWNLLMFQAWRASDSPSQSVSPEAKAGAIR